MMNMLLQVFNSPLFNNMASKAYSTMIQYHDTTAMQDLVEYMDSIGISHDASNNQLTFWLRSSRSPRRERIILDMTGPKDDMIAKVAKLTVYTPHYIGFYLEEVDVDALLREMENAPDTMADARSILKDRADAEDPALRSGSFSIDIAQ